MWTYFHFLLGKYAMPEVISGHSHFPWECPCPEPSRTKKLRNHSVWKWGWLMQEMYYPSPGNKLEVLPGAFYAVTQKECVIMGIPGILGWYGGVERWVGEPSGSRSPTQPCRWPLTREARPASTRAKTRERERGETHILYFGLSLLLEGPAIICSNETFGWIISEFYLSLFPSQRE